MEILQDGIVPFSICIAFYAASYFVPLLTQRWREAQLTLGRLRRYEVRFEELSPAPLDGGALHQMFDAMRELGFEPLGDFRLKSGFQEEVPEKAAPLSAPSSTQEQRFQMTHLTLCRVLVHREHGCLAFVFVAVPKPENVSGLGLRIVSWGGGVSYASIAADFWEANISQRPRDLFTLYGGLTYVLMGAHLLEAHLIRRAEVAKAGGFNWEDPPTLAQVLEFETQYATNCRKFGQNHSALSLWRLQQRADKTARTEWLGQWSDIPPAAPLPPPPSEW